MYKSSYLILVVLVGVAVVQAGAFGRGFGGFHGGGGGFGGFRGGGFGGGYRGGFGGGGFDRGGFDRGGFDRGGFGGGGFDRGGFDRGAYGGGFDRGGFNRGVDAGGFRSGDFGGSRFQAAPTRSQLNGFLGMPTDAGMHAAAGRGFADGHVYQGPRGTDVAHGVAGGRGVAAGTVVKGPAGNVYARGVTAGRGFAAGTHYFSPTHFHAQGIATRGWYAGRGWFTPGWIAGHPWAWYPGRYAPAAWATAAWATASWASLGNWFAWSATPSYYDYGDNVTYQDNNVYYGDQFEATADDYYQQAADLAGTPASTSSKDADWLPLGIFAVVEGDEKKPSITIQLAVDKQGTVRGNSISDVSDTMSAVQGAVDKKSQRVAWTVGDAKTTVYEIGLYNLTKQEAPGLIHFGKDRTEQVVLVRLKQEDQQPAEN